MPVHTVTGEELLRSRRGKRHIEGTTPRRFPKAERKEYFADLRRSMQKHLNQLASDKANIEALNEAYRASDKTPTLRKRPPQK